MGAIYSFGYGGTTQDPMRVGPPHGATSRPPHSGYFGSFGGIAPFYLVLQDSAFWARGFIGRPLSLFTGRDYVLDPGSCQLQLASDVSLCHRVAASLSHIRRQSSSSSSTNGSCRWAFMAESKRCWRRPP